MARSELTAFAHAQVVGGLVRTLLSLNRTGVGKSSIQPTANGGRNGLVRQALCYAGQKKRSLPRGAAEVAARLAKRG